MSVDLALSSSQDGSGDIQPVNQDTKQDDLFCIRWLEDSEYPKLTGMYEEYNDNVPNPALSRIAVAEYQNQIVGFIANSYVPMITMWIDPDFRHTGLWEHLVEKMMPVAQKAGDAGIRTFVVATKPETAAMCEQIGLTKIDYPIYVKDIDRF